MKARVSDTSLQSCLLQPDGAGRSKIRLLPSAAIYGANSAGKTNVLRALHYMRSAVTASQTSWEPGNGTNLFPHAISSNSTSTFEIDFYVDGVRYRYGFTANVDRFLEEWLFSYKNNRKRVVFERESGDGDTASVKFGSHPEDPKFIDTTILRTRDNGLFLSAAAQDNHPIAMEIRAFFMSVYVSSLLDDMDIARESLTSALADQIPPLKKLLLSLLRSADESISDVEIRPLEGKRWADFSKSNRVDFFSTKENRYDVFFVYGKGEKAFRIPFSSQSKGIKKLYGVLGEVIFSFYRRKVLILDEIESSIHPHVARFIVDMFQDPDFNTVGSQLLFSTHDTGLLDQSLLRRDQIWFVEKKSSSSRLYSLQDFSPRKDADLEAGYLRGRYGAIPVARARAPWIVQSDDIEAKLERLSER